MVHWPGSLRSSFSHGVNSFEAVEWRPRDTPLGAEARGQAQHAQHLSRAAENRAHALSPDLSHACHVPAARAHSRTHKMAEEGQVDAREHGDVQRSVMVHVKSEGGGSELAAGAREGQDGGMRNGSGSREGNGSGSKEALAEDAQRDGGKRIADRQKVRPIWVVVCWGGHVRAYHVSCIQT